MTAKKNIELDSGVFYFPGGLWSIYTWIDSIYFILLFFSSSPNQEREVNDDKLGARAIRCLFLFVWKFKAEKTLIFVVCLTFGWDLNSQYLNHLWKRRQNFIFRFFFLLICLRLTLLAEAASIIFYGNYFPTKYIVLKQVRGVQCNVHLNEMTWQSMNAVQQLCKWSFGQAFWD